MSLANGRSYLAIPGPSVMPDRVLRAMHRAAPNIYAGELPDMMPGLVADLKSVARTDGRVAIYIANGHGAWEAALANVHSPGDRALVLATGRFGIGWSEIAASLGIECEILDFGRSSDIDADRVITALKADTDHAIRSVMMVHVDTSTSVRNDVTEVRRALDETGHPALLMMDCIASLGCDRFEMDAWGVDVMVSASQKGLMTPPGLGLVYFNDKADAVHRGARCTTQYWDWTRRGAPEAFYQFFGGTAPTHHLYGLREALDMIAEEGLDNVLTRHRRLATAIWSACRVWGEDGPLALNVADPAKRASGVTALRIGAPWGTKLREWTQANAGLTLGIGLGMETEDDPGSDGFFRIGHMGHVNAHMVLGALGVIEAGMIALDIPHGPGGLSAAAKVCAGG